MKRIFLIPLLILVMLVSCTTLSYSQGVKSATKEQIVEYTTKDNYVLVSKLKYPQVKKQKYPLVVLIHSWGLSSKYWGRVPDLLLKSGFAVLEIDLRGHGKSNYLKNMKQRSYIYLSNDSVSKMPNDVYQILSQVYDTYNNISRKEIAFIGADIGSSIAIYVAENLGKMPDAMVLVSPQVNFKGIYVPNTFVNVGPVPVLAVASVKDTSSVSQIKTLKKYAQGSFSYLKLPSGGTGMTCITVNKGTDETIVNWLRQKTPSMVKKAK